MGAKEEEEEEEEKKKEVVQTNDAKENAIAPETKYSKNFMEIAQIVANGGKPDDVEVIDDMPPDPNAVPSESKMEAKTKPFEENDGQQNGMSWFDQYEASQNGKEDDNMNKSENIDEQQNINDVGVDVDASTEQND